MKQFITLGEMPVEEIEQLLRLAKQLEASPINESLKGKTVALLFMNPSLRTLASFQAGVAQLGGNVFVIQPGAGSWNLEVEDGAVMDGASQEHIRDAIPVLGGYADALAVRCFAAGKDLATDLTDGLIRKMAAMSPVPFINMESAAAHPCQALADWKTLDDLEAPRAGGKFVLSWAWHPRPLPYAVPISAAEMALLRGMDLTISAPEGFDLPQETMHQLGKLGKVTVTRDPLEATEGAHAIYAKSWCAPAFYGKPEEEAEARKELRHWCANESWFENADPSARFMHCLPVRRNVEVTDDVIDGPRSATLQQAKNRLHVQKAVMAAMLGDASQ
ncbi:MAG: N-acetylornithine carbamoyltransferase [Armatimonadetes bacterium]|nr:N-acetylornithine carbamoyltransferase [Armatimonadota bacterium]